jgi:hypothetical protein
VLYGPDGTEVGAKVPTIQADRQYELADAVREKLKNIDSLLDLLYVEWAGRYCLISKWPQSDERWKMYESGEIGAAYDSLGWFCEDMQDPSSLPVSVDSIENKVIELLASCDNTKHHWKDRMKDIIAKNAKVRRDRADKVAEKAADVASTLWQAAGRYDDHKVQRIMEEVAGGEE